MIKHFILLLVSALYIAGPAAAQDDLLDPDKAFAVSAEAAGSDRIEVQWNIADGYYMYRDKIRFESDTPGVKLGEPELPAGKVKEDEFFGTVETYRGRVNVVLPVLEAPAGEPIELTAHSQGCADAGVCYPPHRQAATVELAQAAGEDAAGEVGALGDDLGLDDGDGEILDPEDAFRFSSEVDGDTIVARWDIAPNHYMYRDKLAFSLKDAEGVRLGEPEIPEGERKEDEFFGTVEVFHDRAEARIPVVQEGSGPAGPVTLEATYQGCSEAGLCYPPLTTSAELTLTGAGGSGTETARAEPAPQAPAGGGAAAGGTGGGSDADRFSALLTESSMAMVILYALGFGLLLAFTACMYPMIPILSSIIVGQGEQNMSAGKGFGLASVYVGAMALTFGVIGALMALFGGSIGIQAYFQSPWVLIPFALLFVVLALGMFGFFNIQVPAALQSRLSAISGQQRGGHLLGVGIMGSLSALIIGPCGGPVLIAALAYAAAIGDAGMGFLALFMLGVGMGLPLLVVGAGGGKLLPKAGTWMDVVKAVAGVILLAVAIVFLERMPGIFPPTLTMLLWATLFIVSAIYLGAMTPLPEAVSGWRRLWKGVGTVMLLYGFIVMLGGLTGGSSVVDPLHGSALVAQRGGGGGGADGGAPVQQVEFKTIKTVDDLERELEAAGAEGKTVMLDFYADWCTYCKQFENYVFPEPAVQRALSDTVLLKADVTATDAEDKQLMQSVGVMLPPAILFFGPDGQEMRDHRIVGFMRAEQFAQHVNDAVSRGSGQLARR